jgi:D-tyrosyl-tRNA(Tyr) deacylase
MRLVIQRVSYASVKVGERTVGVIEKGLLVFLGIGENDGEQDIDWLTRKLIQLRIFNDAEEKMNLSVQDVGGSLLVVSQFTLYADCKKGNRPSFTRSAPPAAAIPLYHRFLEKLKSNFTGKIETGEFGAMMRVELLNDGPVTLILDSKYPEF